MKQRIQALLASLVVAFCGTFVFVPAIAHADFKDDACQGVSALDSGGPSNCNGVAGKTLERIVKAVIRILSFVVGFVAVLMVIVGGFKYITSNGDSAAMSSARNTIVYALIGLVIVAVAQILVHFVLFQTSKAV